KRCAKPCYRVDMEKSGISESMEEHNDRETSTEICALDGCDNPLPPPAVDAHGRRKGGRPSSYCCKGHADAASRASRTAQVEAITDPLIELQKLTEAFSTVTRPVLETLTEMATRLEAAEDGALAQIRQAQEETETARREAESSAKETEQAAHARDRALA